MCFSENFAEVLEELQVTTSLNNNLEVQVNIPGLQQKQPFTGVL